MSIAVSKFCHEEEYIENVELVQRKNGKTLIL